MGIMNEERFWNAVVVGSAALAAIAIRNGLKLGWQYVKEEDPPTNPADHSVSWGDALAWTLATSVAVGVGRLLAQRGAAAGWKRAKGRYPRDLNAAG